MFLSIDKLKYFFSSTDSRSVKMYKNTIAMIGIRGISILLTLISTPIMLHHVNRADYGVLLTLTSIVAWVGCMDIGIGNGLRNKLSEYIAIGSLSEAKKAVSSCYATLSLYVLALLFLFLLLSPLIDWVSVLNSPYSDPSEIEKLADVVFIAFCCQFLFGLLNSILFAFQMPAFQSLFTFIGQILAFMALLIQVYIFDVSSVFQIGAINSLMSPFVLLIGSVWLYKGRLKIVAPSFKMIDFKSVSTILSLGVKFFLLQVITIVLFQANSIIIARVISPEAVVEYNIAFKYVSVLTILFNIIITPVWSATTDAYVRKDYSWIKKTLRFTTKMSVCIIIVGFFMAVFSKSIYSIWLGKDTIDIGYSTTFLVLLYLSFEMLYRCYGTFINGTGKIFAQMLLTAIIAICYIPLAVFLGNRMGLPGILLSNAIVFLLNFCWSRLQCVKLLNNTAKGIWNK